MEINSDQEYMSACLASMMTCEQSPAIKEALLAVYDVVKSIETTHNISEIDGVRENVVENFEEMMTAYPGYTLTEINLEELSKCFSAWLWCLRMVELVKDAESHLEAIASIHDLITKMQDAVFRNENC